MMARVIHYEWYGVANKKGIKKERLVLRLHKDYIGSRKNYKKIEKNDNKKA